VKRPIRRALNPEPVAGRSNPSAKPAGVHLPQIGWPLVAREVREAGMISRPNVSGSSISWVFGESKIACWMPALAQPRGRHVPRSPWAGSCTAPAESRARVRSRLGGGHGRRQEIMCRRSGRTRDSSSRTPGTGRGVPGEPLEEAPQARAGTGVSLRPCACMASGTPSPHSGWSRARTWRRSPVSWDTSG
jgi:hypothetical protein